MVSTDTALSNCFAQNSNWSMDNAGNFYGFSNTGFAKVSPLGVVTEAVPYSNWTDTSYRISRSVIQSSDDGLNHYVMQFPKYDKLGILIPSSSRYMNLKRIIYVPAS
jgi:hypothetical protein